MEKTIKTNKENESSNEYIQQEVRIIRHYMMRLISMTGKEVNIDEATELFTKMYAERYSEIWYEGIGQEEIRLRLFYPGLEGKL